MQESFLVAKYLSGSTKPLNIKKTTTQKYPWTNTFKGDALTYYNHFGVFGISSGFYGFTKGSNSQKKWLIYTINAPSPLIPSKNL